MNGPFYSSMDRAFLDIAKTQEKHPSEHSPAPTNESASLDGGQPERQHPSDEAAEMSGVLPPIKLEPHLFENPPRKSSSNDVTSSCPDDVLLDNNIIQKSHLRSP